MTLNEEAEFGDEGNDEGASKGKSAAVALKPIRHNHRAQASSVAGNASSTVANKAPSKKRESKFFYRTMSQLLVRRLKPFRCSIRLTEEHPLLRVIL